MMMNIQKNRGVTLMELMLALVVIAVLLFLAVRYYTVAREGAKVAQAISRIDMAVNASYKWLEGMNQTGFRTINADKLVDKGLLLKQDIKNPWIGTDMSIGPYAVDSDHVSIEYLGIPKTACQSLAAKLKEKTYKSNSECGLKNNAWYFLGVF